MQALSLDRFFKKFEQPASIFFNCIDSAPRLFTSEALKGFFVDSTAALSSPWT